MSSTLIHDLFGEVAERFPSRPAILWRSQTVTYGEIEGAANKLANYLLQKEIPEGSVVAVYSEDTVDIIISILGTLQAGCAFLPLDPYLPPQRLRLMIEEVQPQWFLVASRFARRLIDDILPPDSSIKALCLDSNQTFASEARCEFLTGYTEFAETERPNLVRDPDSLCSIYFTSGSSGRPKAIAGRLRGIDHFARWEVEMLGLDEHSRCSQLTSPAFDGFLRDVCPPLVAGATICVPDSREMILDVARLVRWIDEQSLTVLQCVPSLFRALLNQELSPDQFSALRHVVLVGEPLLPDDVGRFKQVFGDRVQLVNLYGPTETTLIKLFYPVQPGDEERRSIPIGKPLPGCRAVVVDDENKVVAPGTVGEILLRTPYRSLGYYQRPELTAKVFIQNPFSDNPQDIVYRTGDYGRQLPDGTFDFVGRRDLQVKIRGVRVELSEVENALRSHPQVRDLAVGRREDSDGSSYLCAYLVLGAAVDQDELYSHCSERLPESMVPSAFVELDALPRTPNGKVDRARLQTLRGRQVLQTKTFVEPKGPVEELLAEIWCELLGQERMSREANFFESGGHSLRGVQLMARIRSQLGVEMPLRVLFERPVLAALAEVLAERLVGEVHSDLPPLKRAAHNKGPLPLSFSQQRLWFLDQMNPGGSEYNIASAVRLLGPLQPNVLRHTLDEICRRHEVLRTVFTSFEGSPVQVVERPHGAAQVEVDLTALPEAHCQTESQRLVQQERDRPFDLERGPMLRIVLLQVGTEEFIALLVLHHIAGDGWSMGVLMREIAHLYGAFVAGRPSPLPELPIQYADYSRWQRNWLQGAELERQLAYWRRQLTGGDSALELVTDRPRPAVRTNLGGNHSFGWSTQLSASLEQLSRQHGVTLFMTLLAGLQVVLYRYTAEEAINVGTPIAGRDLLETEPMIGFFVNTLVMRTHLAAQRSFTEVLSQVREVVLEAYAHQHLPFEKLVEELQPQRSLQHTPLFQVSFVWHNTPREPFELPGLELGVVPMESSRAKFDLAFSMERRFDGLGGALEYSRDLFDSTTAVRLLDHLHRLLEGVVADSECSLGELDLLSAVERDQLLRVSGELARAAPHPECLHELFAAQAVLNPESVAVVDGARHLTYQQLETTANRLAHRLRRHGVGAEQTVALLMERSCELLVAILAILKAGGAYVPLEIGDPPQRLAAKLTETEPVLLLRHGVPPVEFDGLATKEWALDQIWEGLSEESSQPLPNGAWSESPAYVLYTSGSTGRPKGVVVPHRGVVNYLRWALQAYDVAAGQGAVLHSSISFDLSVTSLFAPLLAGRTVFVAPPHEALEGLGEMLQQQRDLSFIKLTPTHLLALQAVLLGADLGGTRVLIVGGEQLQGEVLKPWRQANTLQVFNEYGPTETVVGCCVHEVSAEFSAGAVPIGTPVASSHHYILGPALRLQPHGVPGELFVAGEGVTRGYLRRPAETATSFLPDPFSTQHGGRLYRTGDRVRLGANGHFEFLERIDHQVKIRGFRVEPGEAETVLRSHLEVAEAAVVARRDASGSQQLVAYLVPANGERCPPAELRHFLQERLPEYLVCSFYVWLDALPTTASSKLDRRALPEPEPVAPVAEFLPPTGVIEQKLATSWQKLLRVERVGRNDNFFELGGHSLLAAQLIFRVRDHFRVELSLREIFEEPELSAMVRIIEGRLAEEQNTGELAEISRLLDSVEGLTDEDVQALLEEEVEPVF